MAKSRTHCEVDEGVIGLAQQRVVYITGITGRIGRSLVRALRDEYDLRGSSLEGGSLPGARVRAGDITDGDFLRREFHEVDTVVHLAADPSPTAPWSSVLKNNIAGTYEVYEAARVAGVRRIVFASTNHVTGILTERWQPMGPDVPVRPDGYYGVSKACGELLGRYYGDRYGLSSICLRIGWYIGDDEEKIIRTFAPRRDAYPLMWLSDGDLVRLFRCAIEAQDILFGIYYGMSNNRHMLWDITNARAELGYEPQDDLAELFARHGLPYPHPPAEGGRPDRG
ncbi:MAG TPA: NAD(P)-dependent oxidoreductase [Limnochordia bacterium]